MIDSIGKIFAALSSAGKTAKAIQKLISNVDGDERALLEEIKENAGLCWLVTERQVSAEKVIEALQTDEYNRLLRTDFDFNRLNRKKIKTSERFRQTDLQAFIGKDTQHLIEGIYDRVKEMKRIHRIDKELHRIRWNVRFYNLHKRILLLLEHLKK